MAVTNVLVVEDNAAHAELIGAAFDGGVDFHLRLAPSLHDARKAIAEEAPELVIADMLLPDGRGTDLLPSGGSPEYPIVVMTGHGDEKMAVEAMKAGAVHYIVKSGSVFAELPGLATSTLREWEHITERRRAEDALQ